MADNVIDEPNVSLSIISADVPVENAPQRVLLIGQMVTSGSGAGSATPSTAVSPTINTNIGNAGQENDLFGAGSQLAIMVRKFKQVAPQVALDAIPLADNGTTSTEYRITLSGTPTESGTIEVIAGSANDYRYTVSVSNGEAAADIITKIYNKINGDVNSPFTIPVVPTTNQLTADCKNAGTWGNLPFGIKLNGAALGIINGLTATIARTTPGATDPTLVAAQFTPAVNTRYQGVVCPGSLGTAAQNWLEDRFNVNNQVLDGVCFSDFVGTETTVISHLTSRNFKSDVVICDEDLGATATDDQYFGPANRNSGIIQATFLAAVRSLRLTPNASISRYVTTNASGDQFGGPSTATLPYHNTNAPQLSTTYAGNAHGFTAIEIENIKAVGGTVLGTNRTGTNAIVGEVLTTFKTDPAGNPDPSFKYLNYVDTISNSREYFFNNYKKRYAQSRLTEGNVQRGRDMVNQATFEGYTDRLYGDQTRPELLLLQGGQAATDFFKNNRVVVLNLLTGTITVNMKVPIITQVRNIIGTIQIAFSTQG